MKRVLIVIGVVFGAMAFPGRADAGLWAWLQDLSGPGWFNGLQFDIRLACVGAVPNSSTALAMIPWQAFAEPWERFVKFDDRRDDDATKWKTSFETANLTSFQTTLSLPLVSSLAGMAAPRPSEPAPSADRLEALRKLPRAARVLSCRLRAFAGSTDGSTCDAEAPKRNDFDFTNRAKTTPENEKAAKQAAAGLDLIADRALVPYRVMSNELGAFFSPAAVALSLCDSKHEQSRASVGLIVRNLSAQKKNGGPFAGGNTIYLNTLGGSLTAKLFAPTTHDKLDVVDIGFALSAYWLSSAGDHSGSFATLTGIMIEPLRLDLHVPSAVRNHKKWGPYVPYFQIGLAAFPAGFPPHAFGPGEGKNEVRIGGHVTGTYSIFVDLTNMVRRPPK